MKFTLQAFIFFIATAAVIFIDGCYGKTFSNVTDAEVRELSEEIFTNESVDFQNHVVKNLQGRETRKKFKDVAPQPFLEVDEAVLETQTLKSVRKLFDNYKIDTREAEVVTSKDYEEEENLIDNLLNTTAINRVMDFLSSRGFINEGNQTYREVLKDVWFCQYARQKSRNAKSSSGFEHVFLGELKTGRKLIGLHNWIFFNFAESSGRLNYWGYRNTKNFGNTAAGLTSTVFFYSGKLKSSTILVGTSPELELSLYTLCYFVRPNRYCPVSMGGTKFGIQTYVLNHTGKTPSLGTAFPLI